MGRRGLLFGVGCALAGVEVGDRGDSRGGAVFQSQLQEDASDMGLDRGFGHFELAGDGMVGDACCQEDHDLVLTVRQLVDPADRVSRIGENGC
jgi:hypothetical protein